MAPPRPTRPVTCPAPMPVTATMESPPTPGAPTEEDFGLRDLENGQMTHDYGADQPLDTETRTELARQLSLTREVADKYPTLQSAVDSGRFRAGPFVPGLGTHMVGAGSFDPDGVIDDNDTRSPQTIIYDGLEPDAPIAGFMYYSMSKDGPKASPARTTTGTTTRTCASVPVLTASTRRWARIAK